MTAPRIVIVGAGPAGVRAAQVLVECGVRPIIVDEGQRDGGQIYRRQPMGFTRAYSKLYGTEAAKAQSLHDTRLRSSTVLPPFSIYWSRSSRQLTKAPSAACG